MAPDVKLEQSINHFSQGPGGHVVVGMSGNAAYITEFDLLFLEVNAITNFHKLTNGHLMDHLETSLQHELGGQKGLIFDNNVLKLFYFIKARQNPFVITGPLPTLSQTSS